MSLRQRLFHSRPSLALWLVRWILRLASLPYAGVMRLRNLAYDRGWKKSQRAEVPVICVGNLSVGGTGKTPMVAWLCAWFRSHDVRVAIVSRGYGELESGSNDEALELELLLPDVPHLQNPDRFAAVQLAYEELDMQAVVLDDGFQHRRLERNLDIVLIDASEPAQTDWCLPGGLMREPWSGLSRADIVVLTRCNLASTARIEQLRERVARHGQKALVIQSETQAIGWHGLNIPFAAIDDLKGKPVVAFCGVGNSDAFFKTLEQLGLELKACRSFPDHHAYSAEDVEQLSHWSAGEEAVAVVCTMKDWVKLQTPRLGPLPLVALRIAITFGRDQAAMSQKLETVLAAT